MATEGIDADKIFAMIRAGQTAVDNKLTEMKASLGSGKAGGSVSIVEMMEMQLMMNRLSQMSEMSTSTLAAMNSAINRSAQNIK